MLPWWEIGAGTLLLLGWWTRAAALLAAALFSAFGVAVTVALIRGLDIDCGCFGTGAGARVGGQTLALDLLAMVLSGLALVHGEAIFSKKEVHTK